MCSDLSVLTGDFFVDAFESAPDKESNWHPVLLLTEYNGSLDIPMKLSSWCDWKAGLGLAGTASTTAENSGLKPIASFRHGSEDSRDSDVIYQVSEWPAADQIQRFVSGSGVEDRNVILVSDGFVQTCFKGLPDEVQNALLATTPLHKQLFPLPLKERAHRSVIARAVVAVRSMFVTRWLRYLFSQFPLHLQFD